MSTDTDEGIDVSHALEFYTRICFTQNLLPQLRSSANPRVISVLSGGLETESKLDISDLNLEKPGAFGALKTQMHMGVMNSLALEQLADEPDNSNIVFIHAYPGIVRTGNLFRGWIEGSWGLWAAGWLIDPVLRLFAFTYKEAGERYVFQATAAAFGGKGVEGVQGKNTRGGTTGGLYLVGRNCDITMNEKEMKKLRVKAKDAVWVKTKEIVGPYV
jgi:hypothetical protein